MTPQEWRDLDPRDAVFLWSANAESNKRTNDANEEARRRANMR